MGAVVSVVILLYADMNNITDNLGNAYIVMPNWTNVSTQGSVVGTGYVSGGGIVGDVDGDGSLSCVDFTWMMECYCTGLAQGANDYYNTNWFLMPNNPQFPPGVSYISSINNALNTFNCGTAFNANCDGSTIS